MAVVIGIFKLIIKKLVQELVGLMLFQQRVVLLIMRMVFGIMLLLQNLEILQVMFVNSMQMAL